MAGLPFMSSSLTRNNLPFPIPHLLLVMFVPRLTVIVYVFVSPGLTSTSVAVTWFIAVVSSPSYTYAYTLAVSA